MEEFNGVYKNGGIDALLMDIRAIESGEGGVTTYGLFGQLEVAKTLRHNAEDYRERLKGDDLTEALDYLDSQMEISSAYDREVNNFNLISYVATTPLLVIPAIEVALALGLSYLVVRGKMSLTRPVTDSTDRLQRVRDYITNRDEQLVADHVNL